MSLTTSRSYRKFTRTLKRFKYRVRSTLFPVYARIKHRVRVWRMLNQPAIQAFRSQPPSLSSHQRELVNNLEAEGIAVTTLDELFPDKPVLDELLTYTTKRLDRARQNPKKKFLDDVIPQIPELGLEVPFVTVAIDPAVVDVVNTYMGMYSKLYHVMVRRTHLMHGEAPRYSQNWHRLPQEKRNCKVYIYLSDVDEESGPFMYIPRSTINKKWAHIAPHSVQGDFYTAEKVEDHVPKEERMQVVGPAGTVIFCDTTGLHRGGYSTGRERIMSTFAYGAPSLRENIHYSYTQDLVEKLADHPPQSRALLVEKWKRAKS